MTEEEHATRERDERITELTRWLALMHDVTRDINDAPTWDHALHRVLQRLCDSEHWQIGYIYLLDTQAPDLIAPVIHCAVPDERFRAFHALSLRQRYARGNSLPGRVYAEGRAVWVDNQKALLAMTPTRAAAIREAGIETAVALPITFERDVIGVLELFSDRPHAPSEQLANLMNDVSAQLAWVLERERSAVQMADVVWREQQGLLHTLHDSLGQTLTGLGMLSAGLSLQLTGADGTVAETARQVTLQAQLALEQVRQLSRGFFPLEIDTAGFMSALRELAATTESFHKIAVQVEGDGPGPMRDSRVASQLYRIAQEAVTNAVKHAHAKTIRIEVQSDAGLAILRIIDDGVGLPSSAAKHEGLGQQIMRYRATSIGGNLSIESGSQKGTVVTCTVRDWPLPTHVRTARNP